MWRTWKDTGITPTVRLQDNRQHRGRRVHGVMGATGCKQDGSLHLFYTLCNVRLQGAGGDHASNYVEHDEPAPITCKRCLALLAREEQTRLKFQARERAHRAAAAAAADLVAHCEALDIEAQCTAYTTPEDRQAYREAVATHIANLRRLVADRRHQPS
jgi:hypothetical protein